MDKNIQDLYAIFNDIVGDNNNFTLPADKEKYEKGYRYGKGLAFCVLRPKNSDQLCKILSICNEYKIAVVPQGGNTGLVSASVPDMSGGQVVISTELLNTDIFEIEGDKLKLGAGWVLDAVNEKLSPHGLFLPIDIGSSGSCNIGGMIATNAAGTRAGRYGNVKARLISYQTALADGSLLDFECKPEQTKQDNSRIDFANPFVGSGGWLGMITKAVFALEKLPKVSDSVVLVPESDGSIKSILDCLTEKFGKKLTAFEGMSNDALKLVAKNIPNCKPMFGKEDATYVLLAEVSGSDENEDVSEELLEAFGSLMEMGLVTNGLQGKPEQYWHMRHHISEALAKEGKVIATDVAVGNRADLANFRQEMTSKLQGVYPDIIIAPFGHEMLGAMHFNMVWPKDKTLSDEKKRDIQSMVYDVIVNKFDGTFSAEHGIGPHNQWAYNKFTPDDIKQKSADLKAKYDPNGIMNPNIYY